MQGEERREPCIVGIGETAYTARGGIKDRGELALACEAVLKAAADAGLPPSAIDGLVSFANDSSVPWVMQESLGLPALKFGSMVWGGGGGGCYAAIAHAASAVESGAASHVAVYRSLCRVRVSVTGRAMTCRTDRRSSTRSACSRRP